MDNITIERPDAMFSTLVPKFSIYRFNHKNFRYYFNLIADTVKFYPSVTSILNKVMPTSYAQLSIISDKGLDGYYKFMNERALYGTILHKCFANFLLDGTLNRQTIGALLFEEDLTNYPNSKYWINDLIKDMSCLAQFAYEHEIEPLAIEVPVIYENDNSPYACAIDLICKMKFNRKIITALMDLKSGKNGFYDSHELQLHLYKQAAEQYFNITIDNVFNLAPVDYSKNTANYKLVNQTDSKFANVINNYLDIYYQIYHTEPEKFIELDDFTIGQEPIVRYIEPIQYILKYMKKVAA
jgi:hypothetical protein